MKKKTKVYVGMDVHKDSVMIAVLPEGAREPTLVRRLSHERRKLRRLPDRLAREHEVRACYEASGAGYVLEREIRSWGHECEIVAPSLIPQRPGERRKHDRKDAEELSRLYRAGELVTIRIPSEREERVRDLVRCRETFQREALKSRHYILKFLAGSRRSAHSATPSTPNTAGAVRTIRRVRGCSSPDTAPTSRRPSCGPGSASNPHPAT